MQKVPEISTLFLDLNSYFASIEQQIEPRYRGQPLIVVPTDSDSTCAIAASYAAKALGIKTNTRVWEAKRICPDLIVVPARHDIYVEYHHRIMDEINRHVPIEKICSIDEVACRLSKWQRTPRAVTALAQKIKQGIWDNVGEAINCSIGVAPNQLLAKVAAESRKPDGLTIWTPEQIPSILYDLELSDIPGIGNNRVKRLNRSGVWNLKQFCSLPPKQVRKIWGSVGGERMWYRLQGYRVPDQPTTKSSIGHSHVLGPELRSPDKARLVARRLCCKAGARVRRGGYLTKRVNLSVKTVKGHRWSQDLTIPQTEDSFCLLNAVDSLWRRMEERLPTGMRIKKVGVSLTQLVEQEAGFTEDLFMREAASKSRDIQASQAMDSVNKKFGRDTLFVGALPGMKAGGRNQQRVVTTDEGMGLYSGAKIAFNRIPERAEFYE